MKPVYFFGPGIEEGHGKMKELLGGKGANLAEMGRLGLPVPYGFTITTEVCLEFYKNQQSLSEPVKEEVKKAMARLEQVTQKRFGDPHNPLLLSVRSGARQSMPGMMDTVLNIGLNDQVVEGLAAKTQNPRFAWDSYRRLIQMFSDVVLGVDHSHFELALEDKKRKKNVTQDADLSEGDW
ncbi:MAG: pyruvate, phosphate dikinase, partial [Bdellovibrionaceae bacterium]|nr:pyruvate, phosphate dikinase [Pseudobdellovibrionaceae bacterium]